MIRRHASSIGHAVSGMIWAFRTQANFKTHFFLIFISFLAGYLLKISYTEWMIVLVTSLMGIIIESVNTAIEKMGDAITTDFNEHIKISKDVSASAMLLYSIGAIVVAVIIFVPKLYFLLF